MTTPPETVLPVTVLPVTVLPVTVLPVVGLPEVADGADLASLIVDALGTAGQDLRSGDVVVVSSKVVSKAGGLRVVGTHRAAAVAAETTRVVAERVGAAGERTRVVEAVAGPVMAAAGVDASNTGGGGGLLLLPRDPDREARRLLDDLRARAGMPATSPLAVILSDTAGRPWRSGQVDFALGAAGLRPLDDRRGSVDADGRALDVTVRAVADEVAAAADLVKGKADAVPVAVVRGLPGTLLAEDPQSVIGARALVRTGPSDWFRWGWVEAVRAALGVPPGSPDSERVGVRSVGAEDLTTRVRRAVDLALAVASFADGMPDDWSEVGIDLGPEHVEVQCDDPFTLGVVAARLEVALHAEDLRVASSQRGETYLRVHVLDAG